MCGGAGDFRGDLQVLWVVFDGEFVVRCVVKRGVVVVLIVVTKNAPLAEDLFFGRC
jgi:hypothetical protein